MVRNCNLTRLLLLVAAATLVASTATAQSGAVKLIKGTITDSRTGKPVGSGRLFVYLPNSSEPASISRINPSTGAFQVVLAPSTTYRFVARAHRFMTSEFTVSTPAGNEFEELSKDFQLEPIPVGKTLLSANVFAAGSSALSESSELKELLSVLRNHPAMVVTVVVAGDPPTAPAKAKGKAAKAPKKKGKKGAPAATVETIAVPAQSETGGEPTLAQKRQAALKTYFYNGDIASSRIKWQLATAPGDIKPLGSDDVVVTITAVKISEAEDE